MEHKNGSIKCLVVDDEPLARKGVELLIAEFDFLSLACSCASAQEAILALQNQEIDLIFSDIEMPGLSGIDLVKNIPLKIPIIFTTAYPQYALQGFELQVLDYLVKPIRLERFAKAAWRAYEHIQKQPLVHQPATHTDQVSKLFLKSGKTTYQVLLNDVLYVEGLKDYVTVVTSQQRIITKMNLKAAETLFAPPLFARVSKSYIVNTSKIDRFENDLLYIQGFEITIGISYSEAFFKQIGI